MTSAVATAPLLGSTEPRVYTPPDRELTPETSLGYAVIRFSENVLGIPLFPWQKWFYIHALELRPDGRLRFKEIHLTVARQNGKTRTIKTLLLWRMFVHHRDQLILGAAQNRSEAFSTWTQVKEEALANPILSPRMQRGSMKSGNEQIRTVWGSSYQVVTLKPDAGRGKTAGTVFFDELREHKDEAAWNALSSTTLVPKDSLIIAASNAGDATSVVMREKRDTCLAAIERQDTTGSRVGWFEWSAPDGCDLDDRQAWAMANPSLGYSLEEEDIEAARSKSDNGFRTENLCQWVDVMATGVIPMENWGYAQDRRIKRAKGSKASVSVDVSWDRSKTSVAVAYDVDGGGGQTRRAVEVVAYRQGMDWVVKWLQDRLTLTDREARKLGLPGGQTGAEWFDGRVAIQGRGCPASSLITKLEAAGITVVKIEGPELAKSAGDFYSKVVNVKDPEDPMIRHRGQPVLDEAARGTMARTAGDAWLLDRRGSATDASPLVACAQADWLHDRPAKEEKRSAYDEGASFAML
ncbi:terminase [Gordonia phage Trine]|uniref:Terminase large subunit n=1 Tax=Gordonia phage Trine TaxID=2201431 RepID=A0A2Z4Q916_9CAUD|nr:terminase [Gordonia phage Trine]AWY06504.1 terminase large subunit [Gordonia phage Trine]